MSITSLDGGLTWPREALISSSSPPTCLPSQTNGLVKTGIRDFAFVRDPNDVMWVAVPDYDTAVFRILTSDDHAVSWLPRGTVGFDGALTFFPTLAADDQAHFGMSFQTIWPSGTGGIMTWFAAQPTAGDLTARFTGVLPISRAYPIGGDGAGTKRSLGDYAGATSIPTGTIPGVSATFMPAWTQGTTGANSMVTAALEQVIP